MAASRFNFPTPPGPGEDHSMCPVCGWSPCTSTCRLGLSKWDLEALEALYADFEPEEYQGPEEGP